MNTFMDRVNSIVQKNQMPQVAPEPVYPDAGIGALENVVSGAPRQTEIMGQPHMLAYINPQEERMLRDAGGAGLPGPDGVPAYWLHSSWGSKKSSTTTNNNDKPSGPPAPTTFYNDYSDPSNPVLDTMSAVEDRRSGDGSTSSDYALAKDTNFNNFASANDNNDNDASNINNNNSFTETLANIFTPFDGAKYVNGQLVDSNTGASISAGGTTSTGNVISGSANNTDNDLPDFGSGSANAAAVNAAVAEAIEYEPLVTNNTPSVAPVTVAPTTVAPVTVAPVVDSNVSSGSSQGATPISIKKAGALPTPSTDRTAATVLAEVQTQLNAAISKAQGNNSSSDPDVYWNDEISDLAAARDRIRDTGEFTISDGLAETKSDLTLDESKGSLNFSPEGSNTLIETVKNFLTPFGPMEYINGELVNVDAGDFTNDPNAANNISGYVNPEAGVGSALLDSAYAKIAAGNTSDLTAKEQMALYGQRGTVPNAAETVALQENYKASGKNTMTQEMQDEIISGMKSFTKKDQIENATQAEIDKYKARSPVGSDANPFYDTYGELGVFGKIAKGIGDLVNFGITNATYGIVNPQQQNESAADAFIKAYESEGSTGGQFDWNDPNALDISPGAEGDANWEKLLEMSSSETGIEPSLQGVVGEDGKTVPGVVEVKNTKDGPVIVTGTGDEDITTGGDGGDDDVVETPKVERPIIAEEIWKRYYKGSGAQFMPPWLRKWMSGESIDLILTKVTVDGKEYYKTKDGRYIEPSELAGTAVSDVDGGSASPFEAETETETETEETIDIGTGG